MMKKIISLIVLLFAFSFGYGQIVAWSMNAPNTAGNETTLDARTLDPNLNMSTLSRGAGINPDALARTFSSDDYTNNGTQADALANDDYFEFDVSAIPTYQVSLTTLDANFRRSNTGPNMFLWKYSLDGVNFIDIGSPISYTGVADGAFNTQTQIDLSSIPALQNVISGTTITFRLYGWGSTNAGGSFAFGRQNSNELSIGGSVTLAPCPGGTTTWNGTTWNNGIPDLSTEAIIDADYDTNTDGSFSACTLTVNGGFNLNVNDGDYVEVENDVTVDGELFVQSEGNFIQNNDTATFTDNSANGVRVNKTKNVANKFVYTYWSSPINNGIIENVFSSVPVDKRFEFIAANFVDLLREIGNSNPPVFVNDPGVDDIDDDGNDWDYASGAMTPGIGYAMRTSALGGPGGGFPRTETFPFIGEFNNGVVTVPLVNNSGGAYNDWNLIGNPYPCAIDADQFFTVNAGIVDAIYLWDQFTAPSETASGNEGFNFSGADYAAINGAGELAGGSGTPPLRFVPSGQGFFVEALSASNVTFNNSMRLITNDNSQFFKGKSSKSNSNDSANKLWINLNSDNGAFNQVLVSYIDGATDLNDGSFYDLKRPVSTGNKALLYTLIEDDNGKFAIQGKASTSLNTDEIIKLGFKTTIDVATIYKISIAQFEGDFLQNNMVYLKDNLTNTVHNLSNGDYSFTSEVGEFNARFEIAFSAASLSNNDFALNANTIKIVQLNSNNVKFTTEASAFKSIAIYDLLGRALYKLDGKNATETYNLSILKSSVYIANIELENGATLSKKFIKN